MTRPWLFAMRATVFVAGALPWGFAIAGERPAAIAQLFHGFCHQHPERTLECGGVLMLVCSRCAGIYGGVALGAVLPALSFMRHRGRWWVLVAAVLMGADVAAQHFGWMPVWHPSRLGTGLLLGLVVSTFVFAVLRAEVGGRREGAPAPQRRG